MKLLGKTFGAFSLMIMTSVAHAGVIYDFSFSNLSTTFDFEDGSKRYFDDFNITLTYEDYVTSSGVKPIKSTPQPTSVGYEVKFVGAHPVSQWLFDDDGAAEINDEGITYNGTSFSVFFFFPEVLTDFIRSPGTHSGYINGNASIFFNDKYHYTAFEGNALLNVIETTQVPEPTPLLLLLGGMAGFLTSLRKNKSR
jgi:hypothetical protein